MMQLARLLLLVHLLTLGHASAQIPVPASALAGAEKAAEQRTIAVGELPRRLVDESAFIDRVVQRSASHTDTRAFEQEIEQISGNVDELGKHIVGKDFELLPLSGLESLERHLIFLDQKLAQLQGDLQSATRPLSEGAGEIAQRRKVWLDTLQSSRDLIPSTLLVSVEALDADFQRAADALAMPLSGLLRLGHQAQLLHARVGDSLLSVRNQIAATGRKLWSFDSANLLALIGSQSTQSDGSLQSVLSGFAIQGEFIKAFDHAYRDRHIALLVAALLVLPLFIALSRWAGKVIRGDAELERYRTTLARPVSAWFLFLVMCWLVVDFNGPIMRRALLLVLAWLPVMRLQPKWVDDGIGPRKYATGVFFVLSFCTVLVSTFPFIYRPLLLVNGTLLLVALVWLIRQLPGLDSGQTARRALLVKAMIAAFAALIVFALLANLAGAVHLAVLVTEASLASLNLALFLFAASEFVSAYAHILRASDAFPKKTRHAGRLFRVAFKLFNLALVVTWLAGTLGSFRVLRLLESELVALSRLAIEFGSISITVGGVVLFCVSVLLSFWIARTLRGVLAEDVLPGMTLPRGVANSVSTMSYYFLLLLGLLVALSAAGFQLSQLALVLGALSVGIGFGLNTVVNNFVCGLILMIERPIQPGDSVEVSGTSGKIRDIGIRTTTLTTSDGADVMIPNGLLLSEKLVNWTFNNERRRIELSLGVAYGSAPRAVQAILYDVARRIEGVSDDPLPVVLFMGFGESSLDFCVRAWTDSFDQAQSIRSEMAIEIHDALRGAGIGVPIPQRDLRIRSIEPGAIRPG